MPAARRRPSQAPAVRAASALPSRFDSSRGGTAWSVSGAPVSGRISLEASAAAGIEMTDAEILAVAISVCEHLAASPLPLGKAEGPRLEAYASAAAIISEAMAIPYDPELLDAGFESEIEARNVIAFREVTQFAKEGGLCPASATRTDNLFYSPWSARASAHNG